MAIKRNEGCHPQWMKKIIVEENNISLFERTELEAKLFWSRFADIMTHIQSLAEYVDKAHLPVSLRRVYIDLIASHLKMVKDLLFVEYGIILDTNPKSENLLANNRQDCLLSLYFWALDNQKEVESILNSCEWVGDFMSFRNNTHDNLEDLFVSHKHTGTSYLHDIDAKLQLAYIYTPYQDDDSSNLENVENCVCEIKETMRSISSLMFGAASAILMMYDNYDALLMDFRANVRGEELIRVWRSDYQLPKERLLSKLKEKKSLTPWVDKICLLHEGKIEKKEIFLNITEPMPRYDSELNKSISWVSIFLIHSILLEYGENQKIINDIMPFFYNDEDASRKFLAQIQGLEPPILTSLVKKLAEKEDNPVLKTKSFYDILSKHKLYTKCYANWNDQMGLSKRSKVQ